MDGKLYAECIERGMIANVTGDQSTAELLWGAHPTFPGVFLKHLVRGDDTEGRLSCHLVKIEPGKVIGEHLHEGTWELHEVIQGKGRCVLGGRIVNYEPGMTAVIPSDVAHEVKAAHDGLILYATFAPALL